MTFLRVTCIRLRAAVEKTHFKDRDILRFLQTDHGPSQRVGFP